MAYRGMEFTVC